MGHDETPRGTRRRARVTTSVAAAVLAVLAVAAFAPPPAQAAGGDTGLWSPSTRGGQTAGDCGRWKLDGNGFCVADDTRDGLEVGVRFQTSQPVRVTGVRIYRVDTSSLRASLWTSTGQLLARGRFGDGPAGAWQDMIFDAPVTIDPGQTYVASYFTPRTRYAFDYGYFARSGRTVGPVTALQSTDAAPNGVHCYDDAVCGSFPVRGYRDSTYWVSPLWTTAPGSTPVTPGGPAPATTPPRVVGVAPTRGGSATKVRVSFSVPVQRSSLTDRTVRLRGPDGQVRVRFAYDAKQRRLVLTPARALRPRTTYTVVVTTGVRDAAGNRVDQDPATPGAQGGTWTVRTR